METGSPSNAETRFVVTNEAHNDLYVNIRPAYGEAAPEHQLFCLQNMQSWIDGERKRIAEEVAKKEAEEDKAPVVCTCSTKGTDVPGMMLLYVKRDCPFHGDKWKA